MTLRRLFPFLIAAAVAGCGNTPPVVTEPDLAKPPARDLAMGGGEDQMGGQEDGPVSIEDMSLPTDDLPMGQDDLPMGQDDLPMGQDDLPMGQDDLPPIGEDMPPPDLSEPPADLTFIPCKVDGDCKDPGSPRCDVAGGGLCVPCLLANDNCPMGQKCVKDNNGYRCAGGCQKDDECKGDGGNVAGACCKNSCADVSSDNNNCGACGNVCGQGKTCCNGGCVDLQADNKNCGACSAACAPPNAAGACMAGKCNLGMCNGGFADCDKLAANGCEVNLNSDPNNCTACGKPCAIANGKGACMNGCVVGACDNGFADCDKMAGNGCEVSTAGDVNNCGACAMKCGAVANGTPACNGGKCVVGTCARNFGDCDKNAANGCEASLVADVKNCGACGKACTAPANAAAVCGSSACGFKCNPGFGDCDGNAGNGCETNTNTNVNNCGACAKRCLAPANASATCANGTCGFTCNAGFADCDKNAANGCEINLNTNVLNCKTCGNRCPTPPNGAPTCTNGVCGIGMCGGAFKDCDMNAGNGCETDTNTNVNNCGFCGTKCATPANATPGCAAGKCGIGACNGGFGNCDANAANGCEVNLNTDAKNCGTCAKVCANVANGTPGCANATCGVGTCNAGFGDCSGGAADGCETNVTNNVNNCGKCGTSCPTPASATRTCVNSVCGFTCNAGRGNCDNNAGNGCETDLTANATHCGACGAACPANLPNGAGSCYASQCLLRCNNNFASCDRNNANGCEINLLTDGKNCGRCGNACPTGVCSNGVCKDNVLVLGAPANASWNNDVQSKLNATGAFNRVDIINANTTTPSLAVLRTYQAVLVYSDTGFASAATLGTNLADYYDGGGRVVVATFANASVALGGRWSTGGYQLINPAGQEQPNVAGNVQIVEANSVLVSGVTALAATQAYRSNGAVINGGVVVARWADGDPLIIRGLKGGRHYVALNMYPPSSSVRADFWNVAGSGANIMRNALLFRGNCHSIVGKNGGLCPSGKSEFCDGPAISPTSGPQAKLACEACYNATCYNETADCAGAGYGPKPAGMYVAGDAYFGYAAGCSGSSGRIWAISYSYTTYGRWAP